MNTDTQKSSTLVLVVDDDEFSHELLAHMLSQLGIEKIKFAENGTRGLTVLRDMSPPPDFLFLDIFMPDMDGIEFLSQLGAQHYSGKVILISGGDRSMLDIARELAISRGIQVIAAISKPMHLSVLKSLLELPVPA